MGARQAPALTDVVGVVLATGRGYGLSGQGPDALCALDGVPLVAHAVRAMRASGSVDAVVVCAPSGTAPQIGAALGVDAPDGPVTVVDECDHGVLARMSSLARFVVVHDCWHPLAPPELVGRVLTAVEQSDVDVAVPVVDVTETVKELDPGGWIVRTVARETLGQTQAPWGVRGGVLAEVWADVATGSPAGVGCGVERIGGPDGPLWSLGRYRVATVTGHPDAFALRGPADLDLAGAVLRVRSRTHG
ncbi:MAG TPA: 2-C-methyl-D-erythritol 4-phosphate cytidylyltransferase [Mycobacteriales bacterium]|jgi:4-diphosphocytidyl-2-methyl-D-erithritol synthase